VTRISDGQQHGSRLMSRLAIPAERSRYGTTRARFVPGRRSLSGVPAGRFAIGRRTVDKTRPHIPMSGCVLPPTKTQAAVPDETLAHADERKSVAS
jgi:hypothetical protein